MALSTFNEQKILFKIISTEPEMPTMESGYNAFHSLRKAAKDNGVQDWSLEEINKEISAARKDKKAVL